jgi:hypothetical protein
MAGAGLGRRTPVGKHSARKAGLAAAAAFRYCYADPTARESAPFFEADLEVHAE